jgi:PBSX family phage portal protein
MTDKQKIIRPAVMASDKPKVEAFTFGEPVPVLDKRELLDYLHCMQMQKWYEPPVSLDGLARSFRSTPHLSSPMYFKANVLTSSYIPHKLLSRDQFRRWVLDYMYSGNGYLERQENRLGGALKLSHSLAKYTRRGIDLDTYWFVRGYNQEHEFETNNVFHLMEADINQEIYGLPEHIPALNSAWLNEAATLFRRKYYQNGSHAGFILYMTDTAQNEGDIDALRTALKDSKGPGNFRNLFMYAPNGKKDGIQIMPISEVAAKDDIGTINEISVKAMQVSSRVPPQLMGQSPEGNSSFGDPLTAAKVFNRNELIPLQSRFEELNEWIGEEVIKFKPYSIEDGADASATA